MDFLGVPSFFKATGAPSTYTNRITVYNNVTFHFAFNGSTGSGTSAGILIDGPGTITLANTASPNNIDQPLTINGPKFVTTGTLGGGSITVETSTLVASGEILGNTTINGILSPGLTRSNGVSISHAIFRSALTLAGLTILEINRGANNSD